MSELERAERWVNEHRGILREIGEHWVQTGEWKTVDQLGRAALRRDDETDVYAALRNLPPALGRVERPEDVVLLRIRGLVVTPSAEQFLHAYVRVFWLAILKLKSDEEDPKVCRADLIEALNLSAEMADRVGQLVLQEDWMFGGGSSVAGDDWVRAVNESTRAVATVTSVDEYLALEGQRFWSKPAAMLPAEHAETGMAGIPGGALISKIAPVAEVERDRRAVAVAYGRDDAARHVVFAFLRAVGLRPLEWEALVAETGSAAPYTGQAVERGFATAQVVVVLFTPDDKVQLHPDLGRDAIRLQARPNVLLEAGMALATHPDRTILLLVGEVDIPTNLSGRNFVRLDGTAEQLPAFAARLERAGCPVDRTGNAWLDTGAFEALGALSRRPASLASAEPHATAQETDSALRIAINRLLEVVREVVEESGCRTRIWST